MEEATKWVLDPVHSEVQFKIRHLVISTVSGFFKKFEATLLAAGDDFNDAKISLMIDADSVDTNYADRDEHLKGPEFFDAAQYPHLNFTSSSFKNKSGEAYELAGELTIKGTTKQVTLDVIYGGTTIDFYGNTRAGFEVNGKINRKDFGLDWAAKTEAGTFVIGEEIRLAIFVEFTREQ